MNREQEQMPESEYLKSLTEKEYKAYEIAKSHLGTSFDLKKSNGFLEWSKKIKSANATANATAN